MQRLIVTYWTGVGRRHWTIVVRRQLFLLLLTAVSISQCLPRLPFSVSSLSRMVLLIHPIAQPCPWESIIPKARRLLNTQQKGLLGHPLSRGVPPFWLSVLTIKLRKEMWTLWVFSVWMRAQKVALRVMLGNVDRRQIRVFWGRSLGPQDERASSKLVILGPFFRS